MANTRDVIGEQECLDGLVENTLTTFEDSDVLKVRARAFYSDNTIQHVTLPNAKDIGIYCFYGCSNLVSVETESVTYVGYYAFQNCQSLTRASFPNSKSAAQYMFNNCYELSDLEMGAPSAIDSETFAQCSSLWADSIDLSNVKSVSSGAFRGACIGKLVLPACTSASANMANGSMIGVIDFGKNVSLANDTFYNAPFLCHLVLRGVTGVINYPSALLTASAISYGLGWIYVPDSLVDGYKAASGWSNFASQIVGVSEYPKTIQDETVSDSWATIAASNTYATDYPIGSIKYLDVGGTKIAMELIATDTDDLAAGGKARMTWLSRGTLLNRRFRTSNDTAGEWTGSGLRKWLRECIYPKIEADARNAIKEVTKTYYYLDQTKSTSDTVWVPSVREVGFSSAQCESSGCQYSSFFTDNNSRKKRQGIKPPSDTSGTYWWLRSSLSFTAACNVASDGTQQSAAVTNTSSICFGFCI